MMSLRMFFPLPSVLTLPSRKLVLSKIVLAKRSIHSSHFFHVPCVSKFGLQVKYGFVAFSDPEDFLRAWKEMNGTFISST